MPVSELATVPSVYSSPANIEVMRQLSHGLAALGTLNVFMPLLALPAGTRKGPYLMVTLSEPYCLKCCGSWNVALGLREAKTGQQARTRQPTGVHVGIL